MNRGVVVAHDSRRFSPEFTQEAALVLAANGDFPTVAYPNPEEAEVFTLALTERQLDWRHLGGVYPQQPGGERPLPANGTVIKTIVTSNMITSLCKEYGVTLMDTHTGFKFIGDKMREFEQTGSHTFPLGYEESYDYLGATFVRDKDAALSALLVAEATAYHKAHGRTLYDTLQAIWAKCGHFLEDLYNVTEPGKEGRRGLRRL